MPLRGLRGQSSRPSVGPRGHAGAPHGSIARPFNATHGGRVVRIDNWRLARVAKLAGAPRDSSAGLVLHARVGNRAEAGQPLFTLHAEAKGELEYAMAYATGGGEIIAIEENV